MFVKKIDEKIRFIFLIISFLFILIVLKVLYIQLFDYKMLNEKATDLWSRNLPLAADRGLILDRNGVVLADNITTTSLVLIPSQLENKEEVSKSLANILNVSKEEMDEHVYKEVSIERVHPEGRQLSFEIADRIDKLNYKGVYLVKESKRFYPNHEMLSHVLGYVGIDNQGLSGIELQYNDYLTGVDGAIKYFSDAKGNSLELSDIYVAPQQGMNIRLTIDYRIQESLERELNNIVSMFSPDMALAIVVDPNNGEILGMSSRPTYDPNNYKNASIETINRNLPIWASYEPGSTFKIITTSAAVNEHVVDLFNDTFYDSGHVTVGGARIGCWKPSGHGLQTYLQVLQNSCNPGFVKLGMLLGKERLFDYIKLFGFGEKTGIDLNGEGEGIIFSLDKVKELELATTAFGQGVSVTPIQQVTAVSAVVNGGNLYKPFIVKSIQEPSTNSIIKSFNTIFVRKTITKETSDIMKYALESVVAQGGGRYAFIKDYRVGGKTGTAQKVENGKYLVNNYIMSFMAVVPSNDPKAILYLAIDNPKNTVLLSSYTTAPIARRILLDIIDALKIEKQEGAIEEKYIWNDIKYFEVPNLIGLKINDAVRSVYPVEIDSSGNGKIIIEQSPSPGEKIDITSKIRVLLGD